MASKEEVIRILEEAVKIEESVVPLYSRHISSTLFLSGFEEQIQARISGILNRLLKDSKRHEKMYEDQLRKVKGSEQNVY